MTNIFSLLQESSIPNEIFSSVYSKEKYVESSIKFLESFNESVSENTMVLYTKIAEAENIKEENEAIKDFISQIQAQLDNLAIKLSSITSRFSIAAMNYCDTAKQMIDNISSAEIDPGISFSGKYLRYNTPELLDAGVPKMNPYGVFEKEFNLIAQLMQDLPVTASNRDKLNVVSTVCDKFNATMSKAITSDIYKDLIDYPGYTEGKEIYSLSQLLLSNFRSKEVEEKPITIEDYQDAVSCISNCDQFISCISEMNDKLITDLRHIISDLNDMLSGCDRNRFKVDTRKDGIRNTIYSVDTYTSNKIIWLVQEKVRQIADAYDKYILALSVKMECIISYIRQSSDIIETFSYIDAKCIVNNCKNRYSTDNNSIEAPDNDSENMDNTGKEITEDEEKESKSDNALDGGDDFLTPEDETENDVEAGDIKEPVPDFTPADYGEFEEAALDFYITVHECSVMMNQASIFEHAISLLEDGEAITSKSSPKAIGTSSNTDASGNSSDNNGGTEAEGTKDVVGYMKDKKKSLWRRIIDKLIKIWEKFKEAFSTTYQEKVEFLKSNDTYITEKGIDYTISMPVIRHNDIDKIKIPDLQEYDNIDKMKEYLKTKDDFIKSNDLLKPFAPKDDGETLSTNIKNSIIDPEEKIKNANEISPSIIYNEYCKDFMNRLTDMKSMTSVIEKGQDVAASMAKKLADTINNESFIGNLTADMYFMEFDASEGKKEEKEEEKKKEEDKKQNKESKTDIEKYLNNYFGVCSTVISTKMFICQKVFDEYYAYLKWHIEKTKDKARDKIEDNKNETKNKENTEEKQTFD